MGFEEIIAIIVAVLFILFRIFGRPAPKGEQPQQQRAPRPTGPIENDPFEELRRRIEEAARRRKQEEEQRTSERAPAAEAERQPPPQPHPQPQYRPQPQPRPQPMPQPEYRPHQQPAPRPEQQYRPQPQPMPRPQAAKPVFIEHEPAPWAPLKLSQPIRRAQKATGLERIERLPPLQRAIIFSEVLGPPAALRSGESRQPGL